MKSLSRSALREHIFKIIFISNFQSKEEEDSYISNYFENLTNENDIRIKLNDEDKEYIAKKVKSIVDKEEEFDQLIDKAATGWSVKRIAKAELSILRLASYEILYDDEVPVNVAINEAVELTKRYGEDNAPAFVNGILATILENKE